MPDHVKTEVLSAPLDKGLLLYPPAKGVFKRLEEKDKTVQSVKQLFQSKALKFLRNYSANSWPLYPKQDKSKVGRCKKAKQNQKRSLQGDQDHD